MPSLMDQSDVLTDQYKDASNLSARFQLHERFSTNKQGWHRWVFDQFDLPEECSILELGCGPGWLWLKNMDRVPDGWEIALSDLSPGMLREAQQNLGASHHRFAFQVIDAQSIPLSAGGFDAVIANHMLYHVPNTAKAFSEICRVLRRGGVLYASTVGRTHMRELGELVSMVGPTADPWGGRAAESFLLENGLDQVSQWFTDVLLHRYEDALIITEAEPLIAYVLSTAAGSALAGDKLTQFIKLVEQELARDGAIRVAKDSGIFEASRGGCASSLLQPSRQ